MATDWHAIEFEYVHNHTLDYRDLAEKYGLKEATVRQRANRHGWKEKRNAVTQAVTEKASAAVQKSIASELVKYNEDDLKVAKALRSQVAKLITMANNEDKPLDPTSLRSLAGALEASQRVARLAMGATTDNTGLSAPSGGPIEHKTENSVNENDVRAIVQALRSEFLGGDAPPCD